MIKAGSGLACLAVIWWCSALYSCSSSLDAEPFPTEFDFRYISYAELLDSGAVFEHDDIVGYVQLTIDHDNQQILVGARDTVFRLSLDNLNEFEHADISATEYKRNICAYKGQTEEDCHNFIHVLLLHNHTNVNSDVENAVFICGTNAFSPECSWRQATNLSHVLETIEGIGKTPFSPYHNSTAIITDNGNYYGATTMDIRDRDPAIYRSMGNNPQLRTVQYNSKWLNEPDFISSYEIGEFVYFFFREVAVEFMNCGKRIYSRVARLCKTDDGGSLLLDATWTTFYKSRLNCSIPGEYPFYFDEVQSTFLYEEDDEKYVYAVFNTPTNSIAGSAVCMYNMTAFNASFTGPFKYQEDQRSAWERHDTNFHPLYECPEDKPTNKRSNEEIAMKMIDNKYQMMDMAVQPDTVTPLLHKMNERWTHIVVDSVWGKDANHTVMLYRVVFVATADGNIRKLIMLPTNNETCLIEEIKVVPNGVKKPIKTMKISHEKRAIYISTSYNQVIKIPVERCSRFTTRGLCLNGSDPYCGWDDNSNVCSPPPAGQPEAHYWSQRMQGCPFIPHPVNGNWSGWSNWSSCAQVGDDTTAGDCQCRSRSCDNPRPYYGGQACTGASVEVTNCTAHGQWTEWSSWSSCSQSCGSESIHMRYRYCSNPPPRFGGRDCIGVDREEEYCMGHPPCPLPPVQGNWTEWTEWSDCSAKCNGGIQTRRRSCVEKPSVKTIPCVGNIQEWRMCNTQICQEIHKMTPWSPWVATNHTKGGYFEERFRFMCRAKVPSQTMINSKHIKTQVRFCFDGGSCHDSDVALVENVNGDWSDWSMWSSCDKKCNGGLRWRQRTCDNPIPLGNGTDCDGHAMEGQQCNEHPCQGVWGCWSEMTPCSHTCGKGVTYRVRQCQSLPPGHEYTIPCEGENEEFVTCHLGPCINIMLASSSNAPGIMEKVQFSLAQMFLVGGLSFILGALAAIALYAYIQSFRKAMKDAKHRETMQKIEESVQREKTLQRRLSKASGFSVRHMPSISSQVSLDNSSLVGTWRPYNPLRNKVYDVETVMKETSFEKEEPVSTLDRQCTLKTFNFKDL